jgi:hypothetical protein
MSAYGRGFLAHHVSVAKRLKPVAGAMSGTVYSWSWSARIECLFANRHRFLACASGFYDAIL